MRGGTCSYPTKSPTTSAGACTAWQVSFKGSSGCSTRAGSAGTWVTQISAATKALEQAGFRLVAAGLTYCLANPKEAESDGYPLGEVQRMFMKLA